MKSEERWPNSDIFPPPPLLAIALSAPMHSARVVQARMRPTHHTLQLQLLQDISDGRTWPDPAVSDRSVRQRSPDGNISNFCSIELCGHFPNRSNPLCPSTCIQVAQVIAARNSMNCFQEVMAALRHVLHPVRLDPQVFPLRLR